MRQIIVELPPPQLNGAASLEQTITRRRSVRRYRTDALTLSEVGQILWSAQGITGASMLRAAPSAGATYPLEMFILVGGRCVSCGETGQTHCYVGAGIYRYELNAHALSLHKAGDLRPDLAGAALDQGFIAVAPVDIIVCAIYRRTSSRYGERAARYVHMEAGHVGENIHLQAVALGLATVEVGAFRDEAVKGVLGVDEYTEPLYIMPLGKPL